MSVKRNIRSTLENGAGYVETYPEVPVAILEVLIEKGDEGATVMAIADEANLCNTESASIALNSLYECGFITFAESKVDPQRNRYSIRNDMVTLLKKLFK